MLRTITIASLLVACSSSKTTPPTTNTPPSGSGSAAAPATSETSCTADADCVAVETQCCDHCNGGKVLAFNSMSAATHKPTGCEQTACTELACGQAVPKCEAGNCTISIAPLQ